MKQDRVLKGNIHHIETLGTFDGPGVRYILFLQGCPFKCQFCHNRDSWSTATNKLMTTDDVINDFNKYSSFYDGGGITVSGGEPLMQLPFLIELFKKFKKMGVHTCIDTSAACYNARQSEDFKELMKYTDLVLLDIKQINDEKHKTLVGSSNKRVLEFAMLLDELKVPVYTRHVLIPGINNDTEDLKALREFLNTLSNIVDINVLPYHTSGKNKWEEMGLTYPLEGVLEPTKEEVRIAEEILKTDYKYMV